MQRSKCVHIYFRGWPVRIHPVWFKPAKPVLGSVCRRLTVGLSLRAEHLDVHRRVNPIKNFSPLLPGVLVTGVDGARLPVGPVKRLVVKREGERVGE